MDKQTAFAVCMIGIAITGITLAVTNPFDLEIAYADKPKELTKFQDSKNDYFVDQYGQLNKSVHGTVDRLLDYTDHTGKQYFVDYKQYDNGDNINFETASTSYSLNKITGNLNQYDGGKIFDGKQIKKNLSHTMKEAPNNVDVWSKHLASDAQPTIQVFDKKIIVTKSNIQTNNSTGITTGLAYDIVYDFEKSGKMEWTYKMKNTDTSKTDDKFGFTFVCNGVGCDDIEIDDQPISSGEAKTKEQIIDKKIKVGKHDFDLKEEQHNSTWAMKKENNKMTVDFTHANKLNVGDELIIDPTFDSLVSVDKHESAVDSTPSNCDGRTWSATHDLTYVTSQIHTTACNVAWFDFDISSIPTGVTPISATFEYDVDSNSGSPTDCVLRHITSEPTATPATTYSEALTGTKMSATDSGCTTTGTDKTISYNSAGLTELQTDIDDADGLHALSLFYDSLTGADMEAKFNDADANLEIEYVTLDPPTTITGLGASSSEPYGVNATWTGCAFDGLTDNTCTLITDVELFDTTSFYYAEQPLPTNAGTDTEYPTATDSISMSSNEILFNFDSSQSTTVVDGTPFDFYTTFDDDTGWDLDENASIIGGELVFGTDTTHFEVYANYDYGSTLCAVSCAFIWTQHQNGWDNSHSGVGENTYIGIADTPYVSDGTNPYPWSQVTMDGVFGGQGGFASTNVFNFQASAWQSTVSEKTTATSHIPMPDSSTYYMLVQYDSSAQTVITTAYSDEDRTTTVRTVTENISAITDLGDLDTISFMMLHENSGQSMDNSDFAVDDFGICDGTTDYTDCDAGTTTITIPDVSGSLNNATAYPTGAGDALWGLNSDQQSEVFTTYTTQGEADTSWVSQDTTQTRVNITDDDLDFDMQGDSTNDAITFDLSQTVCSSSCVVRADIDMTTASTTSSGTYRQYVGLYDLPSSTNADTSQDSIGLKLYADTGSLLFASNDSDNADLPASQDTLYSTPISATQWYLEIIVQSSSTYDLTLYSDDTYTTVVETNTAMTHGATNLQYFGFKNQLASVTGGGFVGTLNKVEIWDNTTTPTGTSTTLIFNDGLLDNSISSFPLNFTSTDNLFEGTNDSQLGAFVRLNDTNDLNLLAFNVTGNNSPTEIGVNSSSMYVRYNGNDVASVSNDCSIFSWCFYGVDRNGPTFTFVRNDTSLGTDTSSQDLGSAVDDEFWIGGNLTDISNGVIASLDEYYINDDSDTTTILKISDRGFESMTSLGLQGNQTHALCPAGISESVACRVQLVNAIGNGDSSDLIYGTSDGLPDAPSITATGASPTQVDIERVAGASDGGDTITHFDLRCEVNETGGWLSTATNSTIANFYNYTGLPTGADLTCQWRDRNAVGYSSWSANGTATSFEDTTATTSHSSSEIVGNVVMVEPTVAIITGSPSPTVSQLTVLFNGSSQSINAVSQVIAKGASHEFDGIYLEIPDGSIYNMTTQATISNTTGTIIAESSGEIIQREYAPVDVVAESVALGYLNYTLDPTDPDNRILKVNRPFDNATSQWDIGCKSVTGFNDAGLQWYNGSDVGFFKDTLIADSGDNVYITCYNPPAILFSTVSYGNLTGILGGFSGFDDQLGSWFGLPMIFMFVFFVAGLFGGRQSGTSMVITLAVIGILGGIGLIAVDEGIWGIMLVLGALGLFASRVRF